MKKTKRKYAAIAKVGYDHATKQPICVKYRFNKLPDFINFITKKYTGLCWINIFEKETGMLKFTYGIKKGLQDATTKN